MGENKDMTNEELKTENSSARLLNMILKKSMNCWNRMTNGYRQKGT